MSSQQVTPRKFLPEVQALRALAVLVVVAYHLEPRVLPGGFVGVDVFFVISGFLITGHLVREARREGRISLPGFWAGRVRRILPAAVVAIAAVVVATLAFAPVTQWGTIGQQALASVFSVQNWVLAADSVDYLAAENPPTALQHFWSLGVEEQFYLLWPLLVVAALLLGRGAIDPLLGSVCTQRELMVDGDGMQSNAGGLQLRPHPLQRHQLGGAHPRKREGVEDQKVTVLALACRGNRFAELVLQSERRYGTTHERVVRYFHLVLAAGHEPRRGPVGGGAFGAGDVQPSSRRGFLHFRG